MTPCSRRSTDVSEGLTAFTFYSKDWIKSKLESRYTRYIPYECFRKMVVHNCDAANEFFVISKVGILTIPRHIPDDCVL